jgi:hypothetical protein
MRRCVIAAPPGDTDCNRMELRAPNHFAAPAALDRKSGGYVCLRRGEVGFCEARIGVESWDEVRPSSDGVGLRRFESSCPRGHAVFRTAPA